MKKYLKPVFFILVSALVAVYFFGENIARTTLKQDNFPLVEKWSTHLDGKVEALSTSNNEIVLARTKYALYALNIESGETIWRQDLSWQADPQPALANKDMVYAVGGKIVNALSKTDGSIIWQQSVYGFAASATDVSENLLVVEDGGNINIYNASKGNLLQKTPACRAVAQAYISSDSVFVPCNGILGINISTGMNSWWEEDKGIIGNTGYSDGVIYFSQGEPDIVGFDLNNGKELWRTPIVIDGFESFDVFNDLLVFADFTKFCAFNRIEGRKLWCVDDVAYPQNPNVIGEIVYLFNGNHKEITAYEIMTGKLIGELKMNNFNFFSTYQKLMTSSKDLLLFANGQDIFAFE
jgi:outer membrane protein assembly factor BamB